MNILLALVAGALGGCVTDEHIRGDVDLDPESAAALDSAALADPVPGEECSLIGGPATAAAMLEGSDYEVTGGPTGSGNGTRFHISDIGFMTRYSPERGTEQGQLNDLMLYFFYRRIIPADLPSLCSTYSCDGCADDYIHKLTLYLDGAPYTVQVGFNASPPERLVALIEGVQTLTTTPLP